MNWADSFNTYTEACEFFGADTPAQIASEMKWRAQEEWAQECDEIEARGGPRPFVHHEGLFPF